MMMANEPIDLVPAGAAGEGGGPQVVELPSTSPEPVIWPEPVKRPEDYVKPKIAAVLEEGTFDVTATISGGIPPFTVDWGDGEVDTGLSEGEHVHGYAAAGDFELAANDADNPTVFFYTGVTVLAIETEEEEEDDTQPWHKFVRHQQFEDYWVENDLGEYPENWDIMTMAQKSTWMDENVE